MNELMYNFLNQIEDISKIREMTVEEFSKLVKSNNLISQEDGNKLIESFKKISSNKIAEDDDANDSDQRKKKYRDQHKEINSTAIDKAEKVVEEIEKDDNSIER